MFKYLTLIFFDIVIINYMSMIIICYSISIHTISISVNCVINNILYYEGKSLNLSR